MGEPCPPTLSGAPLTPAATLALAISLTLRFIHGLEQRLLNATFGGHNLTLQTRTIQSLAFRLGCDFAGLSLSSSTMEWVPQVRGGPGAGWPVPPAQRSSRGLRSGLP